MKQVGANPPADMEDARQTDRALMPAE